MKRVFPFLSVKWAHSPERPSGFLKVTQPVRPEQRHLAQDRMNATIPAGTDRNKTLPQPGTWQPHIARHWTKGGLNESGFNFLMEPDAKRDKRA